MCLLKEIDIFRINGCYCENCVETKSDKIGYTIDLRVDADKIKSVNDLNSKKNNKIMELFERVKYKIHFTPNTLDENLIDELKIFMQ